MLKELKGHILSNNFNWKYKARLGKSRDAKLRSFKVQREEQSLFRIYCTIENQRVFLRATFLQFVVI